MQRHHANPNPTYSADKVKMFEGFLTILRDGVVPRGLAEASPELREEFLKWRNERGHKIIATHSIHDQIPKDSL